LQEELSRYPDLEYCKTDLIAAKGVVFVKYAKASSALQALEDVAAKGMVSSSRHRTKSFADTSRAAAAAAAGSEVNQCCVHVHSSGSGSCVAVGSALHALGDMAARAW
jgi:hypothetical protein